MTTEKRNLLKGTMFISPWIFGFICFLLIPIALSIYYSFCNFPILREPVWVGWDNYTELLHNKVFWKVLGNTFWYAAISIPAGLLVSLGLALLLNVSVPGQSVFRTLFFLPSLTPAAAGAFVWMFLLDQKMGLMTSIMEKFGLLALIVLILVFMVSVVLVAAAYITKRKPSIVSVIVLIVVGVLLLTEAILQMTGRSFLVDWSVRNPNWFGITWYKGTEGQAPPIWQVGALRTFALMSLWGVGNTVVIYLAGLQDVPRELYEAAEIDGASTLRRLWHVTLPMLSPVIFFNLIIAIIGALQNFTAPQLITAGDPDNSSMFYSMKVYNTAFRNLEMGLASAMAWIQLLMVLALTGIAFWLSKRFVHYQGK